MGDSEIDVAADRVAAALTLAVDGLLGVALTSVPRLALVELTGRIETQQRRMTTFDHALVTALADSDACYDVGARNTASLLVQALRVSPTEAAARVRAAKELGPRTDFTGGPCCRSSPTSPPPKGDGSISAAHARVITHTVRDLPSQVRAEHGVPVEQFLVDQATAHAPDYLAKTATARDGGRSLPGCDAPPSWTEAHSQRRDHGGLTDLNNPTLAYGHHHREHQKQGWECQMTDSIPERLPPWWIDEDRTPRRNTTHHLERFIPPDAA